LDNPAVNKHKTEKWSNPLNLSPFLWRLMQYIPRLLYSLGLGPLLGRNILLLTTVGRKSGRRRTVPLTYEESGGEFIVASARGLLGDWMRNIRADPDVEVRVGRRRFAATAEVVTDVSRIADYLQRQMDRNPALFRRIIRMEGLSSEPSRRDLEALAAKRPMAVIRPVCPPK
jgi:deazaflavin-dependent oxidoreductase (nitroreductase family)